MRVLVCGGRDFGDVALLNRTLDNFAKTEIVDCVIEGNARGADRLAGFWARKRGIDNLKFNADWRGHGPAAGPLRNQEMLDKGLPDIVIAFPGGAGTADMVRRAASAGVRVVEIG
jgi:hypothetical protein